MNEKMIFLVAKQRNRALKLLYSNGFQPLSHGITVQASGLSFLIYFMCIRCIRRIYYEYTYSCGTPLMSVEVSNNKWNNTPSSIPYKVRVAFEYKHQEIKDMSCVYTEWGLSLTITPCCKYNGTSKIVSSLYETVVHLISMSTPSGIFLSEFHQLRYLLFVIAQTIVPLCGM